MIRKDKQALITFIISVSMKTAGIEWGAEQKEPLGEAAQQLVQRLKGEGFHPKLITISQSIGAFLERVIKPGVQEGEDLYHRYSIHTYDAYIQFYDIAPTWVSGETVGALVIKLASYKRQDYC